MRNLFTLVAMMFVCSGAMAQLTEQQQIQKLNLVYQQIRNNYVDDVELEPLVDEAIRATIAKLDPHSNYLSKEEMVWLKGRISGEQAGIGISYIVHNDTLVVRSTMDNSPARLADIRPNDRIIAVDNRSIVAISTDSISSLLKGAPDSDVRLQIIRRNVNETINIKLKRDNIKTSTVSSSYRIGEVGYFAISSFSKVTYNDFYKAYKKLGDIGSLVIDLRDNGGGAGTGAIDLASLFLEKGDVIVYHEYRNRQDCITKRSENVMCDIPMVILINENSASASELFTGAMQDNDRAIVVGRTSFGKGLIQRVIDLKDGSGITLTIGRYKTPSGRIIQRPYEMGKRGEYRADSTRYLHPDSISFSDRPAYTTLKKGRKVYGGGGITPDIYIPAENLPLSECVVKAYNEALFEHTIIELCDVIDTEALLQQYPTHEDFATSYDLDNRAMELFYALAGLSEEDITQEDKEYIEVGLMATLAEQLYEENGKHFIYNLRYDKLLRKAIEIASEW